jgi:SAM-dependent methyltransferase
VAGGAGRHARWLASRGLEVTLVDVSDVALSSAPPGVTTIRLDLEREPLPLGPWDVILVHHFLERALLPVLPAVLAPGGILAYAHMTRRNLERHAHPSATYLLEEGELRRSLGAALDVITCEEGWTAEDRHEVRLVARRPR